MGTGYYDWKGNEILVGMTIYFVSTCPSNWGKVGFIIPQQDEQRSEQVWESDEAYKKRVEKPIWHLGLPFLITESKGNLRVEFKMGNYKYSTSLTKTFFDLAPYQLIAIKGVSDKPEM